MRKKITKAASSRAADSGRRVLHCHWYTLVSHRKVTPRVQSAHDDHTADKAKEFKRRNLGME